MGSTADATAPDLPGLTFVRRIGSGGYAEVFLYEQNNTRLRVAVKVLFKENLSDRALDQFAAEAKTMAELADHPNIVQVFGADVTPDGRPYLVMTLNRRVAASCWWVSLILDWWCLSRAKVWPVFTPKRPSSSPVRQGSGLLSSTSSNLCLTSRCWAGVLEMI